MKKTIITSIILVLAVGISSCKKEEENNSTPSNNTGNNSNLTKTQMLTAKPWKITALTVGGSDFFALFDDCDKDDTYTFKPDGSFTNAEGATKCDASDPQIISSGAWIFIDNEKKLFFDGDTATITELTETKMILAGDLLGSPSVTTFSNQ